MKRETENLLLLLVGVSIAMITVGGVFTRYVKPSLLPWLAATAVLLVVLALVTIVVLGSGVYLWLVKRRVSVAEPMDVPLRAS